MNNNDKDIDAISFYSLLACGCTQKWSGQTTAWDYTDDGRTGGLTCSFAGVGAQGGLQRFHNVVH
ncbi:hypothetical protein DPMN_018112 [Dreissena polymorpha]|uniref:Uncharacterized protein n=1 Tax=Dreissena polymorpha TaxID=45954 RepID=A0A9D4NCM5_DREPO|nr:hypothetical protein DPMN_018112 [Dreissena polymorpha]